MLQSFLKQRPQRAGNLHTIPAPIGGWNARDSIADMPESDAILMENWFPTPSDVMLRKGWEDHVTGIGDQVESLMPYSSRTGTNTLFGAAGTSIYDVTSAGTVGAAVVSGLSNSRWQSTNFTNSGGTSYLCAFNGTDNPRYWDGSSWITVTNVSSPAIIGVTVTELNCPWQHQRRLWMTQNSTLKAWYLPVDSVGGTAAALDLSGFARKGGSLVAGSTWTIDAGDGVDDYWVAVTSQGEVIVFRGTDPSSANTWAMVGRWELGKPLGRRCFAKYGGDLLYIAEDGVWPLARALISDRVDPRVAITDKITTAMNEAAVAYGSHFGWDLMFYPGAPFISLNVPVMEGSEQQQYVMNTISESWCKFTGFEANCWALLNGVLYFGGDGYVATAWNDFTDNGNNTEGDCKQAFNYYKTKALKQWTMARPIFASDGVPAISIGLNVDYDDNAPSGTLTFSPTTYGVWDTATWDTGVWGGGLSVLRNWQAVYGAGFCSAIRLQVACRGIEVRWQATDMVWKPGGIL